MDIQELLEKGANLSFTVGGSDLYQFARAISEQTRLQIENEVAAQSTETYFTRQQVVDRLSVDKSTLWRWAKRNYLNPVRVGGLVRYRKSDIDNILNTGK